MYRERFLHRHGGAAKTRWNKPLLTWKALLPPKQPRSRTFRPIQVAPAEGQISPKVDFADL